MAAVGADPAYHTFLHDLHALGIPDLWHEIGMRLKMSKAVDTFSSTQSDAQDRHIKDRLRELQIDYANIAVVDVTSQAA